MTGATVAAFVVAESVGLREPPPLIAALTALLVVQATLAGTLVNGVQRVLSVVAGVALAVLFVSVVGLTWWSLAALVAASIVVGQLLRLGPHLVEVPISAMLVLGVGHAAGAESLGSGRVVETVVGAIVGVLVNIAFPPPVRTRDASGAVAAFADEIAALVSAAADALGRGPIPVDLATQWLEDARRLNRHSPRLDQALVQLEESRRLNLRALRYPQEGGLRSNLDALEHSSVSMRTLFRAVHDATERRTGVQDPEYAESVRCSAATLMADMAAVFRAFGRCASGRVDGTPEEKQAALAGALETLRRRRDTLESVLIGDPRIRHGLWELNAALVTTVDRMLLELDTTTITSDLDQRRTAQALARMRAAVHDATHRPDSRAARGQEPPQSTERP
jgi:Aromatic acid exporter family member 1